MRIPNILKLSVERSLLMTFGAMALLLAIVCVVSVWGMYKSSDLFDIYDALNEKAISLIDIQRQTSQIHRQVFKFIYEGNDSSSKQAFDLIGELKSNIEADQRNFRGSAEVVKSLDDMALRMSTYEQNFQKVVKERMHYHNLIYRDVPVAAQQLAASLAEITTTRNREMASEALIHLEKSQAALILYFEGLERKQRIKSQQEIESLKSTVEQLRQVDAKRNADAFVTIESRIEQYLKIKHDTLQASRSYLFLVNVVMSAEMNEIAFKADQLREKGELIKQQQQAEFVHNREKIVFFIVSVSTIAILSGLVGGYYLSRRVVRPLNSITDVLISLSQGKKDVDIPLYPYQDEIGALVASAVVLKKKNVETESLLAEQKKMTRVLRKNEKELKRSNTDLEHFAYVASHDLKSPLRAIHNLAGWIQEDCEGILPEASNSDLLLLKDRANRMEGLLEGLLQYSRIGRKKEKQEKHQLVDVIENLLKTLNVPKNFAVEIKGELPELTARRGALNLIFGNLISNAIKHHTGPTGKIEISCLTEADMYRICVQDDGPGIDPTQHERIFQMFQTLKSRDEVEGNGLGLALVKRTAELHQASISVESAINNGSRFIVKWPAR